MLQHDFILLDRSGSMEGSIWTEALNGINAYVKKLAEDNVDTGVTLIAFDSNEPFRIVRDRITPKTWKTVTNEDVTPRGGTPLNDATGKLLDLAERGAPWGEQYGRVSIVIMTDGYENASVEYGGYTGTQRIKDRLNRCRDKGWQVTFLGANFDNVAQGASYGAVRGSTISSSAKNLGATMHNMSMKRAVYGATGQSISWSEEEQEEAKSDKPIPTKTTTNSSN
jgi:Mg-chelatase subunit ChlD